MTLDSRLATVVDAARSKKAFRIRLVDVSDIASFTDIFAFMSGGSDRQNRAIAEAVEDALKLTGERPISREGETNGNWVLLDFVDVVVHIFHRSTRTFYNLEKLWGDAKIRRVTAAPARKTPARTTPRSPRAKAKTPKLRP